jgi:hypothetical protein
MEYLLSLNLSESIEFNDNISDKKPEEENLIKLIQSIITDFNSKVEELKKLKEESNNK